MKNMYYIGLDVPFADIASDLLERRLDSFGLPTRLHDHSLDRHWACPLLLDIAVNQDASRCTRCRNPLRV
jgi:hypothetical protein